VIELLHQLGCTINDKEVGLFVWAKIPDSEANVEAWIDDIMMNAQVFLTPGLIFGKNGERYVRVSLCTNESTLNIALDRVRKHLNVEA